MATFQMLLVEDHSGTREAFASLLKSNGYQVMTAGTGEEALNLLKGVRFDLLVTDETLPGLSGSDLVRRASEAGLLATTTVLVLTGAIAGPAGLEVLHKPVDLSDFLARVAKGAQRGRLLHAQLKEFESRGEREVYVRAVAISHKLRDFNDASEELSDSFRGAAIDGDPETPGEIDSAVVDLRGRRQRVEARRKKFAAR